MNEVVQSPVLPNGVEIAYDGFRLAVRTIVFRDTTVEPPSETVATALEAHGVTIVEVTGPYEPGAWDISGGINRRRFLDESRYTPGVRSATERLEVGQLEDPLVLRSAVDGLAYVRGLSKQ